MIPAIRDIGGVRTLVVDDEPFVILGAQCDIWRSTRQDRRVEEFIDAYRDMNATAISFGIPWAKMERERDSYEFSFLDWFIDRTAAAGLKLIVNLFNTNVCGKCEELTEGARYPQYTPDYIKNDSGGFTRIVHNVDIEYHPGGPPLCPNDPATLDREARYLRRVALHLKEHDRSRTVIMVQLNNEYFYQQWAECKDNTQKHVRCVCGFCTAKYDAAEYSTAEAFMFTSFAEYTRTLTDSFKAVYPLPIYVNSPWWAPYIIDIFLQTCPNLDFVGIDGVYSVVEPNQLTVGQRGRNVAFAAESPTEAPATKHYLPMLPYYTVLKMNGLGNLLWEAPDPDTVMYDKAAFVRFQRALYPIRHAMIPLIEARNGNRLIAWYSQSADVEMATEIDIFGNRVDLTKPVFYGGKGTVLVEGDTVRTIGDGPFDVTVGGVTLNVAGSQAGFVIPAREGVIVGTGGASIAIEGSGSVAVEEGRFEGRRWVSEGRPSVANGRFCLAPGLVRILGTSRTCGSRGASDRLPSVNSMEYAPEGRTRTDPNTGVRVRQVTDHPSINHHPFYYLPAMDDAMGHLVFVSHRSGRPEIFVELQEDGTLVQLTEHEGLAEWSVHPSHDGRHVYFTDTGGGWRVEVGSRREEQLFSFDDGRTAIEGQVGAAMGTTTVSHDDRWWAVPVSFGDRSRMLVVDTATGAADYVLEADGIGHPEFHPDDAEWFRYAGSYQARIWVARRDGSRNRLAYERDAAAKEWIVHETWRPGTREIVTTQWPHGMIGIDVDTGEVRRVCSFNAWHAAISRDGSRLVSDTTFPDNGLMVFDATDGVGEPQPLCASEATNEGAHWDTDHCPYDDGPTTVYAPQHTHPHPAFSPDGRQVVFTSDRGGFAQVYVAEVPEAS